MGGACSSKEAEFAFRKPNKLDADLDRIAAIEAERKLRVQAEEAERQRALDAETIRVKLNGPDGTLDVNARLSGSLKEFKEKAAAEVGVSKEFAEHLETHLSGYELEPVTKIMRDFTELCEDSEIDLQGVEKAKEAMKQAAMELDVINAVGRGNIAELELVAECAPERINKANRIGHTPLCYAAYCNQAAAVSFLLSAGANVNQTNGGGDTPLWWAKSDRVRQLLIDAGGHR